MVVVSRRSNAHASQDHPLTAEILAKLWPIETTEREWVGPLPLRDPLLFGRAVHPLGPIDVRQGESLESAQAARNDRTVSEIVISSIVPSIVPSFMRPDSPLSYPTHPVAKMLYTASQRPPELKFSRVLRIGMYLLAIGGFGALLWWALTFIEKVVFLTDVRGPMWLSKKLRPRIGDPIFLVRQTESEFDALCENGFHRIRLSELTTDAVLQERLAKVHQLPPGSCVLIEDFENGVGVEANARTFRLIENVLNLPQRSIVVVSTISPPTMTAIARSAGIDPEPWKALLKRFVWISDDQLKDVPTDPPAAPTKSIPFREQLTSLIERMREFAGSFRRETSSVWLQREAAGDPLLMKIADELKGQTFMSRAEVIDEFTERASAYYDMRWSSCADDEKLILSQLAREGLLNPRSRRSIRRLMGRGLIRRNPQLSLLNESFRKYVLNASAAEEVDVKHVDELDTWSNISRPLAFVLIAVIVMFLITQKDLANTASAIVTALAGGIPALIKLIGVLTDRKQAAA